MTAHPLLDVDEIPGTEPYLRTVGQVFRSFCEQDSGCLSHGVRLPDGTRWFVKEATTDGAQRSLDRAWSFHRTVRHPAIVPQLHRITVGDRRTAVVMPWHDGEILYDPTMSADVVGSPVFTPVRALTRTTWIMFTVMPLVVTPSPLRICSFSTA